MVTLAQRIHESFVNPLGWEDVMTERADFRKFYRDAHAAGCLSEREKIFMGLAVALARNCQY